MLLLPPPMLLLPPPMLPSLLPSPLLASPYPPKKPSHTGREGGLGKK